MLGTSGFQWLEGIQGNNNAGAFMEVDVTEAA